MTTPSPCVQCSTEVRQKQEALQCDYCNRWQHRTCTPAITRECYRQMVQNPDPTFLWFCGNQCREANLAEIAIDEPMENEQESTQPEPESFNLSTLFETPADSTEDEQMTNRIPAEIDGIDEVPENTFQSTLSQRGIPMLVDSMGYSYSAKWKKLTTNTSTTTWLCSVRNKRMHCPVSVHQRGTTFSFGLHSQHTTEIVEEVTMTIPTTAPSAAFKNPKMLARAANRTRQKTRPKEPISVDFKLAT